MANGAGKSIEKPFPRKREGLGMREKYNSGFFAANIGFGHLRAVNRKLGLSPD